MISKIKNYYIVAITILAVVLFFLNKCEDKKVKDPEPSVVTHIKTDTIRDTIADVHTNTIIKKEVDTIKQKVPAKIDTQKILKDYFRKIAYSDTIESDTAEAKVVINDTLQENRIASREVLIKNTRPTKVIHNLQTVKKDGVEIDLGIDVGGNANYFQYSPFIMISPNDKWDLGLRYGLIDNSVHVKVSKKIIDIPK